MQNPPRAAIVIVIAAVLAAALCGYLFFKPSPSLTELEQARAEVIK